MLRLGTIAVISLLLIACGPASFGFTPTERSELMLPEKMGTVEFLAYRDLGEGHFKLKVRTPKGEATYDLWDNWGPATRANLYLAPKSQIVVLGGGGFSTIIQLSPSTMPQEVPWATGAQLDSSEWRYIGAWDRTTDGYRFFRPDEMPECVDLFGAGSTPLRVKYQVPNSC